MKYFLCLDQGGHASRALVLDERGSVTARAVREVATQHSGADRVEQDPEQIVASLFEAAQEAVGALGVRTSQLAAAGLATQRSSIACWDRISGAALSPVISWQDRRAHEWLSQLLSHATEIERRTGLRLSPHYGASKLRWCLDNLKPVHAALRDERLAFGPLASFLAYRLTGEHTLLVDPANAQRTLLWNLAERQWDAWLLELFGVPQQVLPVCVGTAHAFGHLRVGDVGLPLSIVTGDQSAALFAFGAPREDTAYINIGTGAFVQRILNNPNCVPRMLTSIAYDQGMEILDQSRTDIYTLEGTINGAGSALKWASETLGLAVGEEALAGWLKRPGEPPLFLNGIGGLGAPYWVADFRSRFVGECETWRQLVAVAESIVFLIAVNLERMQTQTAVRELVLTGGLAQLDGLCQRLADLTGLPIQRASEHEATARGLAWLLAGRSTRWQVDKGTWFSPREAPELRDRYQRWCTAMNDAINISGRT